MFDFDDAFFDATLLLTLSGERLVCCEDIISLESVFASFGTVFLGKAKMQESKIATAEKAATKIYRFL